MKAMRAAKIGKGERGRGVSGFVKTNAPRLRSHNILSGKEGNGGRGARIRENNFQGVGCGPRSDTRSEQGSPLQQRKAIVFVSQATKARMREWNCDFRVSERRVLYRSSVCAGAAGRAFLAESGR